MRAATLTKATAAPEQQWLFNPTDLFYPKLPNRNSLAWRLLDVLLAGNSLTQIEWLDNSWRLGATVWDLIRLGWPIDSHPVPHPDKPDTAIARYSLPKWVIAWHDGIGANHE
ncbi:hypothetical protein [Sulfurirhabdus autotrophica]|uniref:Uncharacterized protein n=1 Tax=Sulfurirhabdus autotrophica TaxID=1706046 RepID=A0A4R3Y3E2_9PROT|nr:hypothetical protein [Sulfurirhabdus autotrophica]TCV85871.1 hypothetical protein EDC63_10879 [Sulfurirhabdus autotrophica]